MEELQDASTSAVHNHIQSLSESRELCDDAQFNLTRAAALNEQQK